MTKLKTNEELRAQLREKAPEVLEAEMDFDSALMRVLKSRPKEEKKVPIAVQLKPRKRLKRKAS